MATGYVSPSSRTAACTLRKSFSNANSGEWTPMTTSPCSRYFSSHALTYGSARRQLMHEYVQKSTSTTLPRNASRDSGAELSQRVAPASDGIAPSTGNAPATPRVDIIAPVIAPFAGVIVLPDIAGPGKST